MPYASVVLDIPTRALDAAFDYAVPPELAAEAVVGATVLVTFANRAAVGYVVATHDEAPAGVAAEKIRAIEQVLAPSAFDDASARVAGRRPHKPIGSPRTHFFRLTGGRRCSKGARTRSCPCFRADTISSCSTGRRENIFPICRT